MAAVGGTMEHQALHDAGAELLECERRVDERAARDVLDVGIPEDLRKELTEDNVVGWCRQLTAVHERLSAVVGIHESGDRGRKACRIEKQRTEVVEADDDMLAAAVNGNARLGLQRA